MRRRFERKQQPAPADTEPEDALSEDELDLHRAEAVPDRAAMSTVGSDISIPVDPALAADVLSGLADGPDGGPPEDG